MQTYRVKGKMDEVDGSAKRQLGQWPGAKQNQAEGAGQEIKGKIENAWGKTKDAVRDVTDDARKRRDADAEVERERREDVA